jgi:hypothetical protein
MRHRYSGHVDSGDTERGQHFWSVRSWTNGGDDARATASEGRTSTSSFDFVDER